ncbi:MAG TPA: pentapeptide repeat-containing protein, partial [Ktedonobacterales bacterium]|nr:pentapeptide repeat-containing protein [Ktedonobacterales bacterium]
ADLSDAHAEGAMLREARLERARLSAIHMEGANLYRASLQEANLEAATLAGCNLEAARLEGANLYGAHLAGRRMASEDLARVRRGQRDESLPETLPPADLRGACCDHLTNLRHMTPGDPTSGYIRVADVTWGGANLSIVNWNADRQVGAVTLGDEREARRTRLPDGSRKSQALRLKEYEAAVRANRQLAVALQAQGMNEEAAAFAYRALALRRQVLRRQGLRRRGAYLFSLVLDGLAGYGYRPLRTLLLYVGLVVGFAALYYGYGMSVAPHLRWDEALVVSLTAFHGRVFAEGFRPGDPQGIAAAIEAVCGLVIEASFIATFTQRFFGGGK